MTGFGFTGRFRIKKTDDFSSVFSFRKRISGKLLAMHYMPNTLGYPRLGLIIGKKTARLAVQRNYMKRVLRELFRQQRHRLPGLDILVRPQRAFSRQDFSAVRDEFLDLIGKLQQRTGKTT